MTRETKIGLLVGLAFIIVIGILLEDHFSSLSAPKPAPLSEAGDTARSGAATPGTPRTSGPVVVPEEVRPQREVATGVDIRDRRPREIVQVDPRLGEARPIGGAPTAENASQPQADPAHVAVGPREQTGDNARAGEALAERGPMGAGPAADAGDALAEVARRVGEEVVRLDAGPHERSSAAGPGAARPERAARSHVAQAGDSLSKIAARYYGTSTKAGREAIMKANPHLTDPNLIVVGQTYVIPPLEGQSGPAPAERASAATRPANPAPLGPAAPQNIYVTRPGDTLWGIAVSQVGTGRAVQAIKDLNRDVLNGSDLIRPGMRLKLPQRVVASAN